MNSNIITRRFFRSKMTTYLYLSLQFLMCCYLLISLSCQPQRDAVTELPEMPLQLSDPIAGKEINVEYWPTHPRAYFQSADTLIATLLVYTADELRTYRQSMARRDDIFECSWTLPTDAVNISISVSPAEVYRTPERAAAPTIRNGNPLPYGYPLAMLNADSFNELMMLFQQDSALYPQMPARWTGFMNGVRRLENAKAQMPRWIEQLEQETGHSVTDDLKAQFDAAAALAAAWQISGNQSMFNETIDKLQSLAASMAAADVKPSQLSVNVLSTVIYFELQDYAEADFSDERNSTLLNFVRTAAELRNLGLQTALVNFAFKSGELVQKYSAAFTLALESFTAGLPDQDRCALAARSAIIAGLGQCCGILGTLHLAPTLEAQAERISKLASWRPHSADECVCLTDQSGQVTSALLQLARLYRDSLDQNAQLRTLHKILSTQGALTMGAHSLASIELARFHLNQDVLDSAEHYYALAHYMGSPFAEAVLDDLNNKRTAQGMKALEESDILARHADLILPPVVEPVYGSLKLLNGDSLDYSSSEPLFLLFTSISCSVCTEYMPGVHHTLLENFPPQQIVVVSEDAPDIVRELFGDDVRIAPLTREAAMTHQIQILPAVQVVRNNSLELKLASVSNTTGKQLLFRYGKSTSSGNQHQTGKD